MLWIGDRTRQPDHAHVEYCRGIKNPIGLKCGPSLKPDELLQPDRHAQPDERAGPPDADLPLRRRQGGRAPAGADPRREARGPHGRLVVRSRCTATRSRPAPATRPGRSTAILREVRDFFAVHQAEGTHAGGVHLEMTGKNVTECTGGARAITDDDLQRPLPHALRSAAQRRAGAGAGLPDRRADQARAPRARPAGRRSGRVIAAAITVNQKGRPVPPFFMSGFCRPGGRAQYFRPMPAFTTFSVACWPSSLSKAMNWYSARRITLSRIA